MAISMYSSTRNRPTNQSSFGGVSAVNPQSKGDVNQYIDASYTAAKNRLDPIFDQQNDAYQQAMVDRGIPVGGEAYNESFRQLGQNQNDAYTNAANAAIGVGAGLQQQDFGQDATRSQLANALLQQKWGTDLGYYVNDANTALGYSGLNENARQADNSMGYNYSNLGELARQFDAGQDYDYWNQGSQFDFIRDRADQADMQWGQEFWRDVWNDQTGLNQWSDALANALLSPFDPNIPNVGQAFIGAQDSNLNLYNQRRDANSNWWQGIGEGLGEIDWRKLFPGGQSGSGPSGPPV